MSLIKPLDIQYAQGTLDTAGRPLQILEEAHRVALMPVATGRTPGVTPQFNDPTGIASYYGFGKDGLYYEAGVAGRTWKPQESIDDFADKVTDPLRWTTASGNPDLTEGAINYWSDPPFGRRLFLEATSAAAFVADRKGLMVHTPAGDKAIISGRVTTVGEDAELGAALAFCVLLGLQQVGSDADYIFAGYANTVTHTFSLVMGVVVAGVPTVTGTVPVPTGSLEASIAIEIDHGGGTYTCHYSFSPVAEDHTGGSWGTFAAPIALPAGWPSASVPRIHSEFPPFTPLTTRHSIADVRVELGSGPFLGAQRASWYLETSDGTRPLLDSGVGAVCPDELMVMWERDGAGFNTLTLIDVSTPADPLLWRRWGNLPTWERHPRRKHRFWSPGWIDADEGHIMMTRNTTGSVGGDETGEIWIFSLRWDTVVVFNTVGVGRYSLLFDVPTGRVLRETGSWGSRFLYPPTLNGYAISDNYDHTRQALSGVPFVGTYSNISLEEIAPAITYGVNGKVGDDGVFYLAYGIQGTRPSYPASAPCYAGVIALQEGPARHYERRIFQNNDTARIWDTTDEGWIGVALTHARAIWWHQAIEDSPTSDLYGVLSRKDFVGDVADNTRLAPYLDNVSYGTPDRLGSACLNMYLLDSLPIGDEFICIATGWAGDSWVFVLWYDSAIPSNSQSRTYGHTNAAQTFVPPTADLGLLQPSAVFPGWFIYEHEDTIPEVDLCRISGSRLRSEALVPDPQWIGYTRMLGQEAKLRDYTMLRGQSLNRGEFVVELDAKWTPPWNFGDRFVTYEDFTALQSTGIRLFIESERRLLGYVEFRIQGRPALASAEVEVKGFLQWGQLGGLESLTENTVVLTGWANQNNATVRLRIRRLGGLLELMYYDEAAVGFVTVLSVPDVPQAPVLYGMQTLMSDAPGGPACGTMWRIDGFNVAPSDDPLGGAFSRIVDYDSLPSVGASSQGCVVSRQAPPTGVLGSIIIAEGWMFPMFPPQR